MQLPVLLGAAAAMVLAFIIAIVAITSAGAQQPPIPGATTAQQPSVSAPTAPQDSIADGQQQQYTEPFHDRAWEYRPYAVLVWIVHPTLPEFASTVASMAEGIERRAELAEPSAWRVTATAAPMQWSWTLDREIAVDQPQVALADLPEMRAWDKLITVAVRRPAGNTQIVVRELDLRTQTWGPVVEQTVSDLRMLPEVGYQSVSQAFMPLARVEMVRDNHVRLRVRALSMVQRVEYDEEGQAVLVPNEDSPVWIRPNDIMLPVVRRTDRFGATESVRPIDWTYLIIDRQDGAALECTALSTLRTPLAGRTGIRIERLALVIRPPERSTILRLVSRENPNQPLMGFRVYSRPVGATTDDASEYIGKTDWRGEVEIPPSEEGFRVLFVRSGTWRARVPVIPGLFQEATLALPDNGPRLYAEGIITGLQRELMDMVVRRQLYQEQIRMAIENGDLGRARSILQQMREMPGAQQFSQRLVLERRRLPAMAQRDAARIEESFSELRLHSDRQLGQARLTELQRMIQEAENAAAMR